MDKGKFFNKLTVENMPSKDMGAVAESCGIETAVKLLEKFPGAFLYIPKSGYSEMLKDYICRNFDGSNARDLAIETGYSQVHVYRILSANKNIIQGQLDMFSEKEKDEDETDETEDRGN